MARAEERKAGPPCQKIWIQASLSLEAGNGSRGTGQLKAVQGWEDVQRCAVEVQLPVEEKGP